LKLKAFDQHDQEVMTWVWETGNAMNWLKTELSGKGEDNVSVSETDSTLTMAANDISVTINKGKGIISEVKNNENRITSFRNGPLSCTGPDTVIGFSHREEPGCHVAEISFDGSMDRITYKMYPSGWLEMSYSYSLSGKYNYAGITFDFEEGNVMSAKWLGKGPYRVWKNRIQGTKDVWEKAYNNTIAGTFPWNFPEFKGYYTDVSWVELNTIDGKILVATPDQNLFVRLFEFYAFPEPTLFPELPPGDLSFLDAIPPVGSKMSTNMNAKPASFGPQSYKNNMDGTYKHTLYFNFGILN